MNIAKVAGGFLGGAGKIDNIVKAAKGLLCITALLSKFKAADVRNLLGGLAGMAAAAAASIVSAVADAVSDTINGMINTALAPLRMLQGYINTLLNVVNNIGDIIDNIRGNLKNLSAKSFNLRDFLMNTQNCNVQAADFMNCLLKSVTNKLNKKVLSKLENPLRKVDAQLSKLHKEIAAEAFKAGGLMEQYVGKNLRAAEKLTKQLEIMTR